MSATDVPRIFPWTAKRKILSAGLVRQAVLGRNAGLYAGLLGSLMVRVMSLSVWPITRCSLFKMSSHLEGFQGLRLIDLARRAGNTSDRFALLGCGGRRAREQLKGAMLWTCCSVFRARNGVGSTRATRADC